MTPSPSPVPGPLTQAVSPTDGNKLINHQILPRNSISVTNTKGLLNMPGQNNCFLNSAVQVLWHLDIFRRSFRELSGHACMAESCIFCALKELFAQFQYSHESALPPDALRQALAKTFCDQRRFQLGFMDDAAECFENILLRIHVHIANQENEDMCGDLRCIPHQKFAMTLVEQLVCYNCGRTSEPLPFTQMVHYVATSALCANAQEVKIYEKGCCLHDSFGKLLKLAGEMGEVRDCPGECGSKINVKKTLMNRPEIVSVGLVWDSECPSIQHITDVFCNIGMNLRLQDMFHAVVDAEWVNTTYHKLVGVVTYYGKHYSTFFFHSKLRVWIYFDDAAVKEIGPSWEQVVEKCQRGHFQPLLLLFASPDVTSIASAPWRSDQSILQKYDIVEPSTGLTQKQRVMKQYNAFQALLQNGTIQDRNACSNEKYYNAQNTALCYSENVLHGKNESLTSVKCTSCGRFLGSTPCICSSKQPQVSCATSEYANLPAVGFKLPVTDPTELNKLNKTALPCAPKAANSVRTNAAQQNFIQDSNPRKTIHVSTAATAQDYASEGDPGSSNAYISRKAVENVLHLQKVQHQISLNRPYNHGVAGNRNSSSSLESFDNANKLISIQRDVNTSRCDSTRTRRDSGNWSSDHNSSSSISTTSENGFSAVSPKRVMHSLNKFHSPVKTADYSSVNSSDHGYDSYSVSSSDSYPSVGGSPIKLDPHLAQIPEVLKGQNDPEALNKKLQIITEESSGPPDCDKLCAEADLLLAKSHDKEKEGDLIMAALLSDSAAARARAAMEAPYNNPKSLVSAKMKHSTCVMRSSCLYRRIKDDEVDERRKQKGFSGHHSRQSSRDSTHSRHSHQNSKDKTHSKHNNKSSSPQGLEETEAFGKNVEIYGTLPKKGSRRKILSSPDSTKAKDEQVYKDFLEKQRKNFSVSSHPNSDGTKTTKPNQKLESIKSKSDHSNEKHQNRMVQGATSPKSVSHKKQDSSFITVSESLENDGHAKRSNQKQNHSQSGYSPSKKLDFSCDNEINDDLLSPVNSTFKKQHKIKRKLIGGFMKQKNRSLPDLREDQSVPDNLDRSFDDTSLQMSPTLMLPNGTLKKIECQPDPTVNTVTRGFHQPHYAFIKKDLSHRPLLVKVNPPNVQSSILNNSKNKLIRPLPSLPKKTSETKTILNSEVNQKPSKIPFASYVPKKDMDISPAPAPLCPLKSLEILPPPTVRPARTSSIPILTQPPLPVMNATKLATDIVSVTPPAVTNPTSSYLTEDLPPPSNPFLAELQARRLQIVGSSQQKKHEVMKASETIPGSQSRMPESQSQQPEVFGSSDGAFWLQELQSKQHQMLHKPNSQLKSLSPVQKKEFHEFDKGQLKVTSAETSVKMLNPKADVPGPFKCKNDQRPEAPSTTSSTEDMIDGSKCNFKTKNSTSSVKDLASRFEKAVIKTQSPHSSINSSLVSSPSKAGNENGSNISSGGIIFSGSGKSDRHNSQHDCKENVRNPKIENRTSVGILEQQLHPQNKQTSQQTCSPQTKGTENKVTSLPSINHETSVAKSEPAGIVSCVSGVSSSIQQRPQQPPDYETAIQRLEFIRTAPAGETPDDKQFNEFSLPTSSCLSETPSPSESPKRKQGPKKTVTFSDKVVLVACADFEEDFLPNPLLERVYQQHSENGATEALTLSSDMSLMYANERTPVSCDMSAYAAQPHDGEVKVASAQSFSTSYGTTVPCHLCHTKYVVTPNMYCTDCEFYMSRFRP